MQLLCPCSLGLWIFLERSAGLNTCSSPRAGCSHVGQKRTRSMRRSLRLLQINLGFALKKRPGFGFNEAAHISRTRNPALALLRCICRNTALQVRGPPAGSSRYHDNKIARLCRFVPLGRVQASSTDVLADPPYPVTQGMRISRPRSGDVLPNSFFTCDRSEETAVAPDSDQLIDVSRKKPHRNHAMHMHGCSSRAMCHTLRQTHRISRLPADVLLDVVKLLYINAASSAALSASAHYTLGTPRVTSANC